MSKLMVTISRYYKNVLSLIIVIAGLTYLFLNADVHHVSGLDWKIAIALVLLHGIFYFLITLPQLLILRKIDVPISLGQVFSMTIVTNFLNLLLPARGGVLLRGVVFNKKYGMKKRDYAAFSIFISLVSLFILGLMGGFLFPFMDWDGEKPILILQGGALALMILGFYGLYFTKTLAKWNTKLAELYHQKTKWSLINKKENFLFSCIFYSGSLFSYALRVYLLSTYFYLELDFFDASALAVLLLLINTLPILPGNIGIKEASLSGILTLMGHNPQIGFFIAIVDRVMELIFLGILGTIFSFKWNIWFEWGKTNQEQSSH